MNFPDLTHDGTCFCKTDTCQVEAVGLQTFYYKFLNALFTITWYHHNELMWLAQFVTTTNNQLCMKLSYTIKALIALIW